MPFGVSARFAELAEPKEKRRKQNARFALARITMQTSNAIA